MDQERDIRKVDRDKLVDFLKHVEKDDEDKSLEDGDIKDMETVSEQSE